MITINNVSFGGDGKPYIIAELSANHDGSIERAKCSIEAAKLAGASAVKIQTYTPDTMTIDSDKDDFTITDGLWSGHSLYRLYQEAHTPFEWHAELFQYAASIGVTLFSTPFDETAVDLLEELNTPAYKIASFELTDLPLIEYAAKRKKPMLMSTGMANPEEIAEAVECCKQQDNHEILLFHCISSYPAEIADSNLANISYIAREFNVDVGLSDHTTSNFASIMAVSLGASAIEKHFKLDGDDCGPDSSFSIMPDALRSLVEECNLAHEALGVKQFKRSDSEKGMTHFRRSLYFVKNLEKGHVITEGDVRRIRPGYGLAPKYYNDIIGSKLTKTVERGDPVQWTNFGITPSSAGQ